MPFRTLTAATISSWEKEVGPTPIHGVELELEAGGVVEPHCHARGQIMFASSGVTTVSMSGRSWVVSGSRALWMPEGSSHQIVASTASELRNLQVSRKMAPHLPRHPTVISVSPLFRELLASAVAGPNEIRSGSRQEKVLDLLFLEFRPTEDDALTVPEPTDIRLRRICSALRADPSDNRTLSEWAAVAGGCTRTLGRLFLKETGLTFAQWRRQVRLLDALVRLRQGQPVTTVAFDAGYESPSAFIEMFRRVMGRTPGQYLDS